MLSGWHASLAALVSMLVGSENIVLVGLEERLGRSENLRNGEEGLSNPSKRRSNAFETPKAARQALYLVRQAVCTSDKPSETSDKAWKKPMGRKSRRECLSRNTWSVKTEPSCGPVYREGFVGFKTLQK